MNKNEFCVEMAKRTRLTKAECQRQYNNVMNCLYDFIAEGNDISIYGIGQFNVVTKEASIGRNPATGESVEIPAHNVVRFKMSSSLKKAVKELPV